MPRTPTASAPRSRSADRQLRIDDAADDRQGDLERGLIGDAPAALEAALHAEAGEPLREPLAAAVDDDDGRVLALGDDLAQDVLLLGDRRAAELDDDGELLHLRSAATVGAHVE